nr:CPXCG motif-containing cysteine-rich protein [Oceanococcus sp. HetDA_MAG_MS8]
MSFLQEEIPAECPYCGEVITLLVDGTAGAQSYIEDCFVCCRPIVVQVEWDADDDCVLRVAQEDDC